MELALKAPGREFLLCHSVASTSNIYYNNFVDYNAEHHVTGPQVYGIGKKELESFFDIDYEK